jgi:hypothetical protein
MKRTLAGLLAAFALAGCGAGTTSSAENFQGAEKAVATQVEELQEAGQARKPEDICADILSRRLVQELEAAGTTCNEEMERAIEDADDFELDVRDVTVTGNTATARVRRGEDGPVRTFEFARENGQWRATSLSG